jgi:aryl-phospho-beta-D-glucosidase BglC (GH1 family)
MKRLLLGLPGLALLALGSALTLSAASTVPAARLERLTRGVNLSHWFSQNPGFKGRYDHAWFKKYDGPADFALIASAGFRHVRYPVEFEMFLDEKNPGVLQPEFLKDFDTALDQILATGLSVIVDWHAREDTKHRLRTDDQLADAAVQLWGAMATHLASRDPERVFLETMNEPAGDMSLERWTSIQDRLVAAIRAAAPKHTIIVSPNRWTGVDDLLKFTPLADTNVVYDFHFYEPMVFTHQGAEWPKMGIEVLSDLAYPVDPAAKAALLAKLPKGPAQHHLSEYKADLAWIAARLGQAAAWGKRHDVPLTCNEFGVFTKVTPADSRYRWLHDTRETLEQLGIGWAMWDYAGGFRVAVTDKDGKRTLDPDCLKALGL